jgi:hypothetical protein
MCFLGFNHARPIFALLGQVAYKYLLKSRPELEYTKYILFGLFFLLVRFSSLIAFFLWLNRKMPTTAVQWG